MNPNIPIATDNIYKFACLFGLALIITSIFSFVNIYSAGLDRKIKLNAQLVVIEGKAEPTPVDKNTLELNKRIIEVIGMNEKTADFFIGGIFAIGVALSVYGAKRWLNVIQKRDNELADLQIKKLQSEICKLDLECDALRNNSNKYVEESTHDLPFPIQTVSGTC